MLEPDLQSFDPAAFRKTFGLTKQFLAIELPAALAQALKLPKAACAQRDDWHEWLSLLPKARTILLWSSARRPDDQAFFLALAQYLPVDAVLWSFHPLGALCIDRLTGDAVQLLLCTNGLRDTSCANAKIGYYARAFVRSRGSKPLPVPGYSKKAALPRATSRSKAAATAKAQIAAPMSVVRKSKKGKKTRKSTVRSANSLKSQKISSRKAKRT